MTEFTSVDMEMSWISSHEDVMAFLERWLNYVYQRVAASYGAEIASRFGVELVPPAVPFPRISMAEALAVLQTRGYTPPAEKKGDLDPAGERLLGEYIKERYGHDFVFLTDWPASVRPFYHMRHPDDPSLTRSFDLIAHGLEITTGAQREHRYEILKQQALEKGLSLDPLRYYLDFFRFGCPPHGGFGFGLARFLMVMLGIANIRETVFLFRGPTRLQP
jgi:aspartyl-tRNA synthetase